MQELRRIWGELRWRKELSENTRVLKEVYSRLGVAASLEDMQKDVWQGGKLIKPKIDAWNVSLTTGIEFRYPGTAIGHDIIIIPNPNAGAGYWSGGPHPSEPDSVTDEIYTYRAMMREGLSVSIYLGEPGWRLFVGSRLIPLEENQDYVEQFQLALEEDTQQRRADGRLPLSKLVEQGQREIDKFLRHGKS